jgi:hypothetical protein
MSILSDLDKLSKIQDKLKDNKKDAKVNYAISNFAAQMNPTSKNEKQEQKAKDFYKDIDNAIDDVKNAKKDLKKGQAAADQSKKLAKRFEKFLKSGNLDRAEQLMGHINKKDNIDISPYLSKNVGKIVDKAAVNLSINFDMPREQLIAQADYPAPFENKNFSDLQSIGGVVKDGLQGFPRLRELRDFLNYKSKYKQDMFDSILNRGNKKDQSSAAFGDLLAGVDFDDPSNWPSIKDADSLKEIPVKYDEEMDLLAPQIIPLETASLQGINFNTSFG